MCRLIDNWNIVECDVKQQINQTSESRISYCDCHGINVCTCRYNLKPSYYKIYGFYGRTLFSFILFIIARLSKTKIKHFLGEDGYILYKIEWKSANITLKNIPWDDPLYPAPSQTYFIVSKYMHCVCSSPSRRRDAFTSPTYMKY